MTNMPSTRFAPSPTGPLHMGSLVTALARYLHVKQQSGRWHVRIDDIDPPRQQTGAIQAILKSLQFHGLIHDGPVIYQSAHQTQYKLALKSLGASTFYCRCSRRSLVNMQVYPGTCRNFTSPRDDSAVRFRVPTGSLSYTDGFNGLQQVDAARSVGDFIVRRRDGLIAYSLATAVDDAEYDLVLRGQDLQPVTPNQILLMQALQISVPQYIHIPVLRFADGTKLSKQSHAPALKDDQAQQNLVAALRYMNCSPPKDLAIPQLINWGLEHWQLSRIPDVLPAFTN